MSRETPAVVEITRIFGGETQTIYSCRAHQFRTMAKHRENGDEELVIAKADPAHHGCKGCLDDWPS